METITIELSLDGCKKALKQLEKYQKSLKDKLDEIFNRVADFGLVRAQENFDAALYDGVKDVTVEVDKIENGYAVRANGTTVLFLEFGAGVHYPNDHPKAGELGIAHGTYGKGLGINDYLFYTGQPGNAGGELAHGHKNTTITHGNPANMPMFRSSEAMRGEIQRIAQEVLGK